MPKPTRTLLDDVLANLPKKGQKPWHETLPPEVLAEIEQLRSKFLAGEIPAATKTGFANALAKSLTARGIVIGHRGVEAWLTAKR